MKSLRQFFSKWSALMAIALIIGCVPVLFFIVFLIGEGINGLIDGKWGVLPLFIMMIYTVGGYFWSFRNVKTAGFMLLSGAVIMAIYLIIMGGIEGWKMSMAFSIPFIIPGLLFLYATRSIRGESPSHS